MAIKPIPVKAGGQAFRVKPRYSMINAMTMRRMPTGFRMAYWLNGLLVNCFDEVTIKGHVFQ